VGTYNLQGREGKEKESHSENAKALGKVFTRQTKKRKRGQLDKTRLALW